MARAIGQVATSSASKVPVSSTAYTEPSAGAQLSVYSSSANDAAAGTGVRQVRITYYKLTAGVVSGPFVEVVTLNGATAVPTVGTALCLIEKVEAVAVGSGGVAAGTITLYSNATGTGGSVITTIAAGDVTTRLGHHYVSTGYQCRITDLEMTGGDTAAALVEVDRVTYPLPAPEQPVTGPYGTSSTTPRGVTFADAPNAPIAGPARIRLLVTPANTDAQTTYASFGYVDQRVAAF